jgi:spermidine synthase
MTTEPSLGTRAAVLGVFFFSGVSGLVYQVIWVRQFGNTFGNTVYSASLVAGVFMAGLGAGAYVLGRAGDRAFRRHPRRPLQMYACAELAVAACGIALALLLPHMGRVSAATSSYVQGDRGWYALSAGSNALRYVVAIALVAPPTFLMGGTLTLLIRAVVAKSVASAGQRSGALYGANTAGAALGALLTDLALVPALGVFRTQLVAVVINVAAGAVALGLARAIPSRETGVPDATRAPLPAAAPVRGGAETWATALTLLLAGFAAMGLEILWFRFLSSTLGARRAVFSLLLAVILTGIGAGSFAGSWLHRRLGRPAVLLLVAECLLAVTTLALVGFVDQHAAVWSGFARLKEAFDAAPAWKRALLELWMSLRPIALLVGIPALLMGMSFPLAQANAQRVEASVGHRAGVLYLATCVGNVLGCALVGFVLLPALGAQTTVLVLAGCAAASAVPAYLSARPFDSEDEARIAAVSVATAGGLAVIAIAAFAALPGDRLLRESFQLDAAAGTKRVLDISEGVNETLVVTDVPGFFRELLTNGHPMSSTHPKAQRYMRAFSHVPLLSIDHPRGVLVICFGVGTTASAAALHASVARLDVADLSRGVLDHAAWFMATNHDVLRDPRASVFVNDGRHHLLMQPEATYDLITLEPPPISFAGIGSLYSREFYELARSRLTAGGYLTQWLPAYQVPEAQVRAAVRAFVDVFPASVLLSGDDNELILMGTRGPAIRMDLDAVARRLRSSPEVQADLDRVELGDLTDLAGMFAASHATLVGATRGVAPVTDDNPSLEYSVLSPLADARMPPDLFDVSGVEDWCPGCTARLPRLAGYLRVRAAVYASDSFLVTAAGRRRPAPFDIARVPGGPEIVAANPYLRTMLGGAALPAKRAAIASLRAGRTEEAIDLLDLARFYDPDDADTYEQLGHAFDSIGRPEVARVALDVASRLRHPSPPAAP